jgi:glycosyltransferase involved in cell wall biosynthesis
MPLAFSLLDPHRLHLEETSRPDRTSRRAVFPSGRLSVIRETLPVTATILTKNSAARLDEVLGALHWCGEVIVFDTGSTDATLSLAAKYANVVVYRMAGEFPGFGRARRTAVGLARHDWILSIDSDEIVTPGLAAEIAKLELDPDTVYAMPFENYFNGRHITTCGWAPDRHERLFNRTVTNFCESEVHERVRTAGLSVRLLRHPVRHHSYESLDDFLRKMRSYGQLFAAQHVGRKKTGPLTAVSRGAWAFLKSYLLQRGIFQGSEGFVISAYKAQAVFWKYLLLHEANRRARA